LVSRHGLVDVMHAQKVMVDNPLNNVEGTEAYEHAPYE
jgi:hypothetical protein